MLIYLDANIVQYCADEYDFIFGESEAPETNDIGLRRCFESLKEGLSFVR